jgi:hypothetical protein
MAAVIKAKLKESDGELAIMSLVYIGVWIVPIEDVVSVKHLLIQREDGDMLISKRSINDETHQNIIEEAFNRNAVDLTLLGEFEYSDDFGEGFDEMK